MIETTVTQIPWRRPGTPAWFCGECRIIQDHTTLCANCGEANVCTLRPTFEPFKTEPFKHQYETWLKSKAEKFYGFLFDPGCGKTWLDINTAAWQFDLDLIDALVVAAPKGLYLNWVDEITKCLPDFIETDVAIWASDANKETSLVLRKALNDSAKKLKVLLINIESVGYTKTKTGVNKPSRGGLYLKEYLLGTRAHLVIDESTVIKTADSARTKSMIAIGNYASYRRIMTGSFTDESPMDAFSQCEFLSPQVLGHASIFTFKRRFCQMSKQLRAGFSKADINKRNATFLQVDGYKNLDELREKVSRYAMIVREEDCQDLPQRVYQKHYVEMTTKQATLYRDMKKESIALIEKHLADKAGKVAIDPTAFEALMAADNFEEFSRIFTENPEALAEVDPAQTSTAKIVLTQLMRLHQIACGFVTTDDGVEHATDTSNPSVDAVLELLTQIRGKVIIWANYRYNIKELVAAIGAKFGAETVAAYYGDTSDADREKVRKGFGDPTNPQRFTVMNQQTGGRGLTMLDKSLETEAQYNLFFSNDYSRERRKQSEKRTHRIGQTKRVFYIDLVRTGTVDVKILEAHSKKESLSQQITASTWKEYLGVAA